MTTSCQLSILKYVKSIVFSSCKVIMLLLKIVRRHLGSLCLSHLTLKTANVAWMPPWVTMCFHTLPLAIRLFPTAVSLDVWKSVFSYYSIFLHELIKAVKIWVTVFKYFYDSQKFELKMRSGALFPWYVVSLKSPSKNRIPEFLSALFYLK